MHFVSYLFHRYRYTQKFDLCKMSHRPQAKRRRIELSLKTKIDLLRSAESVPKLNQKHLTEKFGIGTSTVSDILKKKEEYEFLKKFTKANLLETGSCRNGTYSKVPWRSGFASFPCIYIYIYILSTQRCWCA